MPASPAAPAPDGSTCIASLRSQSWDGEVEVLTAGTPAAAAAALIQARGSIIAITDWRCSCPPGWLAALAAAHQSGDGAVIGGAVLNAGPDTVAGWAAYLADYGPFAPPFPAGPPTLLAGNHVSYPRQLVQDNISALQRGYRKTFFHQHLEQQGTSFRLDPNLEIECWQTDGARDFARRYRHEAQAFARQRAAGISFGERWLRVAATPVLAGLLLARRVSAVWPKPHYRARLWRTLPLLAWFCWCWAAGEAEGWLRGPFRAEH